MQAQSEADSVRFFRDKARMEMAAEKLKRLRESASRKLSIRAVAGAIGIPSSSYNFYEDTKRFKKRFLPLEFARQIAPVFAAYGISVSEVLALAGIEEEQGETVAGRASLEPTVQLVTMQVALPSEAALARMFEGLLRPLDRTLPVDELAQALAQLLPIGFAQLRDLAPEHAQAIETARVVAAPIPANGDRGQLPA